MRKSRKIWSQSACKPGSVQPAGPKTRTDVTAIHLGRLLPDASRNLPGQRTWKPAWPGLLRAVLSLFGFAPGGVYHAAAVARGAVGSYPTLSPLPRTDPGRFAFCGTFPEVALAGRYPAPCFPGARTFLPRGLSALAAAAVRPTGAPGLIWVFRQGQAIRRRSTASHKRQFPSPTEAINLSHVRSSSRGVS